MEKLHIDFPVLVEGKYDKIKLDSILDGTVITTGGFKIFKDKEKRTMIRAFASKSKIIILSDSDHAGMMIRSHIKGLVPPEKIIHLYTPQVKGKEKRKANPSKEGYVGVEGTDADILRELFKPFANGEAVNNTRKLTKGDLFALGLSGTDNAAIKREKLAMLLGLPKDISANALIEACNIISDYDSVVKLVEQINI